MSLPTKHPQPARRWLDDGAEPVIQTVEIAHEERDGESFAVVRFSDAEGVIRVVRMTEQAVLGAMAGSVHFLRQARRQNCAGCGLQGKDHPNDKCRTWH